MAIEIWTARGLYNVRNNLSADYIQMADIDLSSYANWEPIMDDDAWEFFSGTYDGNGFTISNLTVNGSDPNKGDGLFAGLIGNLKNITIANADISGGPDCAGILVGLVFAGTIENCRVQGTVQSSGFCGGLVGSVYDHWAVKAFQIIDCFSDATVIGGWAGGGLCGEILLDEASEVLVERCSAFGNTGSLEASGGLIGGIYNRGLANGANGASVVVSNCYAIGDVSITSSEEGWSAGGLVGDLGGPGISVSKCFSKGLITYPEGTDTGGLIGYISHVDEVTITDSYYDSQTSGQSDDDGRGTPKTTAEMLSVLTYSGWGFDTVWGMGQGLNDGYPWLISEYDTTLLPQVKQPTWADYKLTWEDVENALSYIVKLYNAAGVVVSTQTVAPGVKLFDFSSILSAGTFTATVQASGVTPV